MKALPVTVVSGYLGAGKTTLLNRVLAEPLGQRIAVLVNDFGDIAIDEALIENADGDTIALANGCICCSIGDDLFRALEKLLQMELRPDRLLIETSGVADPARIAAIARAEPELHLEGCVVLVDAVNFGQGLGDPHLADTLRRQVAAADLVVMTKTDIADESTVASVASHIETLGTPWLKADHDAALLRVVADLFPKRPADARHDHDHGGEYSSWAWRGSRSIDLSALRTFLGRESEPYRLKGFVNSGGSVYEIQRAGETIDFRALVTPREPVVVGIGLAARFDVARFEHEWNRLPDTTHSNWN